MQTRKFLLLATLVLACTAVRALGQGTLISVTGPIPPNIQGNQYSLPFLTNGFSRGVSWAATGAFNDVQISLALGAVPGATARAYLMTRIGPGTTMADEVASTTFSSPATPSLMPVFSGLNLAAGTYYLIVEGLTIGQTGYGYWAGDPSRIITSVPGVTANGEYFNNISMDTVYPPASSFSHSSPTYLEYTVTGYAIPEASTWALFSAGGLLLAARLFRKAKT